jgi:hypothetical protein
VGASKTFSEPMVHLAQTVHQYHTQTNTVSKWTETRFHMTQVTEELHWVRPKRFSEPVVRSAQSVHLSCIKISTINKQTESSFHLSLIT